jgi:hypothetical protein
MLDELAVIPQLAPFVEPIKLIGRWSVSPMQNAGLADATIEQVETALQVFETSNWWTAVQSVIKEKLFAGEVTTIDGIKEIVEGA